MKRSLLFIPSFFLALVVWAQPTVIFEEQFDGGIPDTWEIGPGTPVGAVWQWSANGEADSALLDTVMTAAIFWGDRMAINSPSADNGAAMYNSDVYDAGGINAGQGPYPNGTTGTLTSPSIDCSGESTVYLSFYQYTRAFFTTNYNPGRGDFYSNVVEVSNDGGATWTSYSINRSFTDNRESPRDHNLLLDISDVAGGQADVKVRFSWEGRYYYWLVDDVQLITPPQYALSLDTFFYTPASYAQPVTHVGTDTFAFNIQISNLGSEPIPNLVFKASVLQVSGNTTELVYSDSLVLDQFPAMFKDSSLTLEQNWAPELDLGDYRLRYEVYSQDQAVKDQDYTPYNDVRTAPFRVTAVLFAMEDEPDLGTRPAQGGDYLIGNFYQMSPLVGNGFQIRELRFSCAKNSSDGPLTGDEVTFLVYKVNDDVAANWSNFDENSDESLEVVGFGTYQFTAGDANYDLITVDVFNLDGEPIVLEANARYFVMASYADQASVIFHAFEDDIDYFQVSTVLKSDQWYLGAFGADLSAVLKMVIEMNPNATRDENPLEDKAMTLFPNPSSEVLNVQLNLEEAAPAMLVMADLNGQILNIREYQNVQKETKQFDVSRLPAGTYLMRLSTEKGTKTKQFVVMK